MGNCWGSSAANQSSSADTHLAATGTSSQSTSTMTMTTTSAGSSISPISLFSASSGDEGPPHGQILPHPNLRIFSFAAELRLKTLGGAVVQPLPWALRLKIAVGAARGLAFLPLPKASHLSRLQGLEHTARRILQCQDLRLWPGQGGSFRKPVSCLNPGHGNTRLCSSGVHRDRHLYVKSDVFGFGVVLLEMLTGLRAVDPSRPSGQENLVEWVKPYLSERRKLKTIMDSMLQGKYPSKLVYEIAQLALNCLAPEPKSRPSMEEVVRTLETLEAATEKAAESTDRSGSRSAAHRQLWHVLLLLVLCTRKRVAIRDFSFVFLVNFNRAITY
ncbi:uncharacterized protein J3R85_002388 [Psidium guajava]|nr:uncharacterized protein J3R85_002388 [Psidium guajava]